MAKTPAKKSAKKGAKPASADAEELNHSASTSTKS